MARSGIDLTEDPFPIQVKIASNKLNVGFSGPGVRKSVRVPIPFWISRYLKSHDKGTKMFRSCNEDIVLEPCGTYFVEEASD